MFVPVLTAAALLWMGIPTTGGDGAATIALTRRNTSSSSPAVSRPRDPAITIPAETEVPVQLLSGVHSRVSRAGDSVVAELGQPLYVNGQIALPAGTLIDGRITRLRPAGRLRRPAELTLRFERIDLPNGETEPIRAVLTGLEVSKQAKTRLDPEGYLKGARSVSWKWVTGGVVGLAGFVSIKGALAGSAAAGLLVPVGGSALLTYYLAWPRGNEVHVPPDTRFRLRLTYPVTVHPNG